MKGYGVSDEDMPSFPWSTRRDASAAEDTSLEALLTGPEAPDDLSAGLQPAADVLAALRARPSGDELAGEAMAMAEFRSRVGVSDPSRRPRRRRPALLTSLLSAKAAVAAAAVAIALGGVATAAYAGALPGSAQKIAHDWIGAPAQKDAHHWPAASPAQRAAFALCAAYAHAKADGTAAQQAAALSKLEKAAGGASKVTAYCREVRHHRFHHGHRFGCWPMPTGSWSPGPSPTPSAAPSPTASATASPAPTPSCSPRPFPTPSFSPRPGHHHHFPPGPFPFRHHHRHFPHHPSPHPSMTPSPFPSSTPSAFPSGRPTSQP
jgi:hypothetical protein